MSMTTETVRFGDVIGSTNQEPWHLEKFVEHWFRPDDDVVISGFPYPQGRKIFTSVKAETIREFASSVVDLSSGEDGRQTLYFGINPVRDTSLIQRNQRGSNNSREIYGFFIDLDVKPGSFESKKQIGEFLVSLPIQPTLVVDGGKGGGVHAYWRLNDFDTSKATKEHLKMFWCWVQSLAPDGVSIDGLIDKERLARLPSAPRWNGSFMEDRIRLVGGTEKRIRLTDVVNASEAAYEAHKASVREVRQRVLQQDKHLEENAGGLNNLLTKMLIERNVNKLDWADILTPHGWELLRTGHDGERHWQRPGGKGKSAVTDYTHEDGTTSGVMSMFSMSPDTGLLGLKEAGIHLTKYRVLLELTYGGDVNALITDYRN